MVIALETKQRDGLVVEQFSDISQGLRAFALGDQPLEYGVATWITYTELSPVIFGIAQCSQVQITDSGCLQDFSKPSFRKARLTGERSQPHINEYADGFS